MEVDGKPSMSMPPPVSAVPCCVCYPRNGGWVRVLNEKGCVCVASGIAIKIPLDGLPEGGYSEKGGRRVRRAET